MDEHPLIRPMSDYGQFVRDALHKGGIVMTASPRKSRKDVVHRRFASMQAFRDLRVSTRGLIAGPWTPASLSLFAGVKGAELRTPKEA